MNNTHVKIKKTVDFLNQRGLDGLIVYSNGACNILRPNYLHYFAGCYPLGPHNAAVVSKSGRVVLLTEPAWDSYRVSKKSWIEDTRGTSDFSQDLPGIMKELGIAGAVGLAGSDEMTMALYRVVANEAKVEPAENIIEELAREKTPEELDIVRKVARIADVGFQAFFEHSRVGIREFELVAEMELAMRSAGADDNFTLLSSEKHNFAMHTPTDKRLTEGDIVIGEISPVYEGQIIQICRTVVLGKPAPILEEKYNMLVHALDESLSRVKTGNPASGISIAMNKIISDAGYGKYCYPPYMRARGHGFGVGSIAPGGLIDDDNHTPLERDQVVVVHPNQYLPETGYLACGETVVVTDSGFERLAETKTKLYTKEV